jgi:GntR family transcriptional regulator, transcriptional repressor for pyruvate dehydrogenase complex
MPDPDAPAAKRVRRPAKMGEVIADAIADEILENNLEPGTRLPNEAQMMERYEAGRGTVREALRLLEADGLIDVRPGLGGGPVVREPDVERVARRLSILLRLSGSTFGAVVDARKALEPTLAQRAATAATPEQIEALRASVDRLAAAQDAGGQAFIDENSRFHSLVAEASDNPVLQTFWLAIRAIVDGQEVGVRYDDAARAAVVGAHQRVLAAIEARDPDLAAEEMGRHVSALDRHLAEHHPELIDHPITPRRLIDPTTS